MEKRNNLLKPKIDVVFHALFREDNKHMLGNLISSILKEKVIIKTLDKNRFADIDNAEQKLGILDLRAELEGNKQCIIEIQLQQQKDEINRILYYWANSYYRQVKKGENYDTLNKTISIIILDHEINEIKNVQKLGAKWKIMTEDNGLHLLTDKLEIVIIEIPKAIREYKKNKNEAISQWMMFFDNPNNEEVSEIMVTNKEIKEAEEELEKISGNEELCRVLELREKARRDYESAIAFADEKGRLKGLAEGEKRGIEKGLAEGKKEGLKEGILETARNMLKDNAPIELIIKYTGLTLKEIENIKNK